MTGTPLRLAGIVEESITDGPGVRYVVFAQGCPHRCPGCHNPHTHDPAGGYETTTTELSAAFLKSAESNPLLRGVTLSGGEPFAQARGFAPFAAAVKDAGFDLWVYTGWRLEELAARDHPDEFALLRMADTLVDGRFEIAGRTLEIPFVGSANQRILSRENISRVLGES
jgi:anaerobic ribonucleoside-triphosphate reductase activating protein